MKENYDEAVTLERLCERIGLAADETALIVQLASTLQYTADLVGVDVFIDCFYEGGTKCMVVAEAKPQGILSAYDRCVIGEDATIENEPAVFAVRATGLPVRDLRATTQENKQVLQDVIPIKNGRSETFGVLIRETDVSDRVIQDKKYGELVKIVEGLNERLSKTGDPSSQTPNKDPLAMAEIHHRIKNNLQMVASILNMQARRTVSPEMKQTLKENVGRVLSFAAIHEIMTRNGLEEELAVLEIIEKVRRNTVAYSNHEEKHILIKTEGNDFPVSAENAASIALVVNELLANAVEHAFAGRNSGTIVVAINRGNQYSSITVSDNGNGFNFIDESEGHLGLAIVDMTVRERLKGKLSIYSDNNGSRVRFDFKN